MLLIYSTIVVFTGDGRELGFGLVSPGHASSAVGHKRSFSARTPRGPSGSTLSDTCKS